MNDATNAAAPGVCLVLPEKAHIQLSHLRDQLGMMAQIAYAVTKEEEEALLEIKRSVLGSCFETAAVQLEEILQTVKSAGHARTRSSLREEHRNETAPPPAAT